MSQRRRYGLFISCLFLAGHNADPTFRPELKEAKLWCHKIDVERLWAAGVFDAQIEGATIPLASALGAPKLKQIAKEFARQQGYLGFAFGECRDGSQYVVATPAPAGLPIAQNRLKLPTSILEKFCQQWVATAAGPQLVIKEGQFSSIATDGGPVTSLGVSCRPRAKKPRGKQLWYLAPVGKGPPKNLTDVPSGAITREAVTAWINNRRANLGLSPVGRSDLLNRTAEHLIADGTIRHDPARLAAAAQKIHEVQGEFLGEDRVKAPSLADALWYLWVSPQHRKLLINPKASHLGIELVEDKVAGTVTIVLAMATLRH